MKYRIVTLALICMLIVSCGQYGPLYLPGHETSKATKNHNSAPTIASVVESSKP